MSKQQLLDFGYIEFIEAWGSDERIIETARMSTNKGFLGWGGPRCNICGFEVLESHFTKGMDCPSCKAPKAIKPWGDEHLLEYLYGHKHDTPFEFAGLVIEVQAPLFVFREWHRHRTQSYNEMSARYTPMPDQNYLPTVERCLQVNAKNKQAGKAKGAKQLTHDDAFAWLQSLQDVYEHAEQVYQEGLAMGIPKEIARLPIPVGRYSKMRAQANLRNWLAFMTLRSTMKGPNAQWEIRQFADALGTIIQEHYPKTWDLFVEGKR